MTRYAYRQTSYRAMLLLLPIAAVIGIPFVLAANQQKPPPLFIPLAVIAFVAVVIAIFSTMIVEVTESNIAVGFLFGAMRRRIPLTDIVCAERSNIAWWHGTGVKYGWKATSYLIWPGPAVALTLKSGRIIRIGTNDPGALLAALNT